MPTNLVCVRAWAYVICAFCVHFCQDLCFWALRNTILLRDDLGGSCMVIVMIEVENWNILDAVCPSGHSAELH